MTFSKHIWPMPGSDQQEIDRIMLEHELKERRVEVLEVAPDVWEMLCAKDFAVMDRAPAFASALGVLPFGVEIEPRYVIALGMVNVRMTARLKRVEIDFAFTFPEPDGDR